jgi:putative PIN family toxin of toxin-antitoxin system
MRLVLDTNVVVSGLLWNGLPRTLLSACTAVPELAFTSVELLREFMETLSKPKFSDKLAASGFSPEELLKRYAELTMVVRPAPVPRLAPDPDDDVVIGTAIAAKADFVVTGDLALLSVGSYTGGRIVRVTEAIEIVTAYRADRKFR